MNQLTNQIQYYLSYCELKACRIPGSFVCVT